MTDSPFVDRGQRTDEENCPRELWFVEGADGPWEWKGPIAQSGQCMYGKFFSGRAGFVSTEWFPDFANFRRNGYDFDARYDDGLASRKGGNKRFDTVITRLQMQTYVNIADFVYMQDKYGKPYGWGVAKYSTPEELLGYDAVTSAYHRRTEDSRQRILEHLTHLLPDTPEAQIAKLIK